MRSRLLSLLVAATLPVAVLAGRSFAVTSEHARSMAAGPAAVSPLDAKDDSDADRGMDDSCEKMHQDMMGGMGDDMRRMHDEMMGEMDRSDPGS